MTTCCADCQLYENGCKHTEDDYKCDQWLGPDGCGDENRAACNPCPDFKDMEAK